MCKCNWIMMIILIVLVHTSFQGGFSITKIERMEIFQGTKVILKTSNKQRSVIYLYPMKLWNVFGYRQTFHLIKILHYIFRSIIQCSLLCNEDQNCGAFDWNETIHQCILISKEGLLCDIDEVDSISANLVHKSEPLPSSCQGQGMVL